MYGVSSQDPLWDPTGGGAGLSLREMHGQTQPSSPRAALKGTLMDGEMTSHLIGVTWSDGEGRTPKSNQQNNSGSPKSHSARPLFLAQEVLRRVGRVVKEGVPMEVTFRGLECLPQSCSHYSPALRVRETKRTTQLLLSIFSQSCPPVSLRLNR